MKQVPEKPKKLGSTDLEIQDRRLRELASNSHFMQLRRLGLSGDFISVLEKTMKDELGQAKSPDRVAADLRPIGRALPVVFSKLAQLKRDDCLWTILEAKKALADPGHLFHFEQVEKTVPVTLLLLEVELMFSFFMLKRVDEFVKDFPHQKGDRNLVDLSEAPLELQHLAGGWGKPKPYAYANVVADYIYKLNEVTVERLDKIFGPRRDNKRRKDFYQGHVLPDKDENRLGGAGFGVPLAFAFMAEQQLVLSTLPREVRQRAASWQCRIPESALCDGGLEKLSIGLHPETEKVYWENRRPAFCSIKSNHHHAAIVLPGEIYHIFDAQTKGHENQRVLLY